MRNSSEQLKSLSLQCPSQGGPGRASRLSGRIAILSLALLSRWEDGKEQSFASLRSLPNFLEAPQFSPRSWCTVYPLFNTHTSRTRKVLCAEGVGRRGVLPTVSRVSRCCYADRHRPFPTGEEGEPHKL